uniref:NIDO domain-containing protein n=1 Tax=Romanomermis culicivorax TaxID=13658 RepID=A0A915JE09_ROMCU
MVGTRGYKANYALIVTWERMGFGGQPKFLKIQDYERVKKWLNTYQMVITTDEVRSYVLFNYARINYTSSAPSGAIGGRGGRQSALVGFNAGNGTGFFELPYSSQGDSYKLVLNGATDTQGRWLARVDELVQYGGCSPPSLGTIGSVTLVTKIGAIAKGISNTGKYWFNPNQVQKTWMLKDSWKKFWGGVVQVHVADNTVKDRGS